MIKNKDEIKVYYQTHDSSIKDTAAHFDIPYRTLAHWVKQEKWEKCKSIHIQDNKTLQNHIVKSNINEVLEVAKIKVKKELKQQIGEVHIDEITLNNVLDSSSDEILMKALGISFIDKSMAQSALLAKDELLKLNAQRLENPKGDPMFIACAEKVVKIFSDLKVSVYGKNINIQTQNTNDLENLSTDELLSMISQN